MCPYGRVQEMTGSELLTLHAGALKVVLAPGTGGSIARFDWHSPDRVVPILRGAAGAPQDVLEAGNFPLVPYCNRIRGGAFRFRGREIRLEPNMAGDSSPLHGEGWLSPWQIVRATANQ